MPTEKETRAYACLDAVKIIAWPKFGAMPIGILGAYIKLLCFSADSNGEIEEEYILPDGISTLCRCEMDEAKEISNRIRGLFTYADDRGMVSPLTGNNGVTIFRR
jgi:hypothetical protein